MRIENWNLDNTKQFENTPMNLLGAATRKMMFFKPYVLAFYTSKKPITADEAIESNTVRNMELIINSEMISGSLLAMGLKEGLSRSTYGKIPTLQPKFKEILNLFEASPIKVGDRFDLYFDEIQQLKVYHNGELNFTESDSNFIKAIYSIWFSDDFDRKIRTTLLGG